MEQDISFSTIFYQDISLTLTITFKHQREYDRTLADFESQVL